MSKPLTVKAVMVSLALYPDLPASATVGEAIALLRGGTEPSQYGGFRHVLVLDERGRPIGTASMLTLLRGLEPETLRAVPDAAFQGFATPFQGDAGMAVELFWEKVLAEGLKGEYHRKPLAQVAESITVTVTPDTTLARALCLMLANDLVVLPVVEQGKVHGVVRLVDLFNRIAELIPGQDS